MMTKNEEIVVIVILEIESLNSAEGHAHERVVLGNFPCHLDLG